MNVPVPVEAPRQERLRRLAVFLGTLVLFVALSIIVWQNVRIYQASNNHHADTVALLDEHTATLKEVAKLQKEFDLAVKEGVPALVDGQNDLRMAIDWIECAVVTSPNQCGKPPSIPVSP